MNSITNIINRESVEKTLEVNYTLGNSCTVGAPNKGESIFDEIGSNKGIFVICRKLSQISQF